MAKRLSFVNFCSSFGAPEVRDYQTLGFKALVCVNDEGQETFINPPKSGDALTLVDFSKSQQAIAKALEKNYQDLTVLVGSKESDGTPCYTLVDTLEDNFPEAVKVNIKF